MLHVLVIAATMWGSCFAGDVPLHFTNLTIADGLSHNAVYAILEDRQGFLWFGTRVGLSRYDGVQFKNFRHDPLDMNSLSGKLVTAIDEDDSGYLWVGTREGMLNRYDPAYERFTMIDHPGLNHSITSILCDTEGNVWAGTEHGLVMISPGSEQDSTFLHDSVDPNSICDSHITALHEYPAGTLWAGTRSNALIKINLLDRKVTNIRKGPFQVSSEAITYITGIISDSTRGCLWVSTFPDGLYNLNLDTESVRTYGVTVQHPNVPSINALYDLDLDRGGKLWLASVSGLVQFDPETEQYTFHEEDLTLERGFRGKVVYSILVDHQGLLWMGTGSNGINRCDPSQIRFQHFSKGARDGLSINSNEVYDIMEDRQGDLWVVTVGGGTNRLNLAKGTTRLYMTDDSQPTGWSINYANKILEDQQGNIWIATFSAGLNRFDARTGARRLLRHYPEDETSISHNDIYSIHESRDGRIWVGTNGGGLNEYIPGADRFIRYRHEKNNPGSLASDIIYSIVEDQKGVLWLGTADAGLCRLDRKTGEFKSYRAESGPGQGPYSDHILHLFLDHADNLWMGARNGGLTMLDSARKQFIQSDLGWQPNELEISGILEDDENYLWVSSNRGILKVDPVGGLRSVYVESDGVQSLDFKFGSCEQDSRGYMYFGGSNGFNRFHPDSIRNNDHLPPVVLTKLWINHEEIEIGDELEGREILSKSITHTGRLDLSYRQKVLRFRFAALDFTDPLRNRYAYRMEPFDEEWIHSGNGNEVTYTSLDPGNYTFRIMASNNDGIWNETGASLQIVIKPPFWETMLFRAAMLIMLVVGVLVFVKLRTVQLQAQKRRLETLVRKRTEELRLEMEQRQQVEREKILQGMEHLKRELLTKTLHLNEKQEIMEGLQADLDDIAKTIPAQSRSRISKLLRFLKDRTTTRQGWQEFELWFTEVHTSFYDNLRKSHPDLLESELKVCALLRLNLTSKDIANIMNIQPHSINIYRHRIRKKMDLPGEEDLISFLGRF